MRQHLRQAAFHRPPQLLREQYGLSAARFAVKERAFRHVAAQHFLQAHGLTAELQSVGGAFLRIDHPMRVQVTPCGMAASSTVTV